MPRNGLHSTEYCIFLKQLPNRLTAVSARGTNGEGLAITFISTEEQFQFKRIEEFLDKEIYKIPIDPKFGETPLYEPEKYSNMRRGRGRPRKDGGKGKSNNHPGGGNQRRRGRPRKEA